jgi:hypothetical protein
VYASTLPAGAAARLTVLSIWTEGVKVTEAVSDTPSAVAVTVAVPAASEDNLVSARPPLVATLGDSNAPNVVSKLTVVPSTTQFPYWSLTSARKVELPPALRLSGLATNTTSWGGSGVIGVSVGVGVRVGVGEAVGVAVGVSEGVRVGVTV